MRGRFPSLLSAMMTIRTKTNRLVGRWRRRGQQDRIKGVSQQILTRLQCDENVLTCSTDLRPRRSEESSLTAQEKSGSAYGDRTRISALRGPCPNRLDERASSEKSSRD